MILMKRRKVTSRLARRLLKKTRMTTQMTRASRRILQKALKAMKVLRKKKRVLSKSRTTRWLVRMTRINQTLKKGEERVRMATALRLVIKFIHKILMKKLRQRNFVRKKSLQDLGIIWINN